MNKSVMLIASLGVAFMAGCSQEEKQTTNVVEKETVAKTELADTESFKDKVSKDAEAFRNFYTERFPDVEPSDFNNGVYAIDEASREQWLEIEDFPPYELSVDDGQELFDIAFANGKSYKDCFGDGNVRQNYPQFNVETNQVVTLELAINKCRTDNGEEPLPYGDGEIADVSAFMAFQSRDQAQTIAVPNEAAYNAYLSGKKFFYSKRGQLNMSCQNCHMGAFATMLRADKLGPAYGHTTGFPVYRGAWEALGSLHKRYAECNRNVRAKPFAFQSEEYRNLEFFESLMSEGLELNGPSSRK